MRLGWRHGQQVRDGPGVVPEDVAIAHAVRAAFGDDDSPGGEQARGRVHGGARIAGFQVRAGSPDWTANAFAGMAAKGYDASTAWSNPAAMTLLPDS